MWHRVGPCREQSTTGEVIAITTSLPRDDSMEDDLELLVSVDIESNNDNNDSKPNLIYDLFLK